MEFVAPYGKPGAKALEIPGTLLSFYAVKIVSDGSPQQETAFQLQPYLNSTTTGLPNYTADELNALVLKVKQAAGPSRFIATATRRCERALDAIEAAYGSASAAEGHQPHRTLHARQSRPNRAHEATRRAAKPPDEQHLLLRRRVSRPDIRCGARQPFQSGARSFLPREFRFRSTATARVRRSRRCAKSVRRSRASARSTVR